MSLSDNDFLYAGTQPTDDDKKLFVTFSFEPRIDRRATEAAGRNVYKDVEFVTLRIPGDKTLSIHRPVVASDRQRFPLQYAAFKNTSGEQVVGTPLSLWPGMKPSQIKELEYFNIKTVEQLASMPDGSSGALMAGIQSLRNAARQYVAQAKDAAPLLKVQSELVERDNQIAALNETVRQQGETLDKLIANMAKSVHEDAESGKAKKGK